MSTNARDEALARLRELMRPERREELLREMTPDQRELFDSITKLRDEIGPVDFNIVRALREMRNGA